MRMLGKKSAEAVYIIAEAGVNHNGDLELARRLIDIAADAGADAVKFQTFQAGKLTSRQAPKAAYQKLNTTSEETQFEMLSKLELNAVAHRLLIDHCRRRDIQFLSTPFDPESMDLLAGTFDLPVLKIPSGEITNGPFLLKAARTGKILVLSTGMSTLGEIETALGVLAFGYLDDNGQPSPEKMQRAYCSEAGQDALAAKVTLLHCTTEYPAPYEEVNLRAMVTMQHAFGLSVGLSDHTPGIAVPAAAVALGAVVIEKHFTLDKNMPGPDHSASLAPDELRAMIASVRQIEKALGDGRKIPSPAELKNRDVARKSLVAACPISKGESFREDNIAIKRPGTGLSPMAYWSLLNGAANRSYEKDDLIDTLNCIAPNVVIESNESEKK